MRTLLVVFWLAAPAQAQTAAAVPAAAHRVLGPSLTIRKCRPDWREKRTGDCWIDVGSDAAYVHRGGWLVASRCLSDRRFDPGEFLAALDAAARKMDPSVSAGGGGCLGTFNPGLGRKMQDAVWGKLTFIDCPPFDPQDKYCADNASNDGADYIRIRNIKGCLGPDTTGLAGTIFHETLHAAGADNFPVEIHNQPWSLPQYKFVRDRVYGTEATCFFGTQAATRKKANFLQCLETIRFENDAPDRALCRGFDMYFGDMPPSTAK